MIDARFSGQLGPFTLDAAFRVPGHGITALFGPSGCGKTSVLRCVAGLTRLAGALSVNGEVWQSDRVFRPVHRRPLAYVFQEASLFPHLSVAGNLGYGRRRARGQTIAYDEVVELLGIGPLLDRPVPRLSGGERQRVAIGRALLSQPGLLLMDEPLSALDRDAREDILPYLERLHARLSVPVLYVTHDMTEVERLADTLVLMERGRVRAQGALTEMLADPALPLLHRAEPGAVIDGLIRCYGPHYGLSEVDVPGGRMLVPGELGPNGGRCRLRIAARDVSLGRQPPDDTSILNALPARILGRDPAGPHQMTVRLALGPEGEGAVILSRISRLSWDRLQLKPGDMVFTRIKAVALVDPLTLPR